MRVIHVRSTARPGHEGHAAPITHVEFRADGRRLATSSYDGTVIVWDTCDPGRPRQLCRLPHRRLVNASAWNPVHPDLLATASADKTVAVWSVAEGQAPAVRATLARHTDDINSVAWMPDGERLICVSEDGRASLWDAAGGRFLEAIAAHAAHCMMVSVSAAGLVATVGEDGMVAVRRADAGRDPAAGPDTRADGADAPDGVPTRPVTRRYGCSVEGCAWSHSGEMLAITRDDGVVDVLSPGLAEILSVPVSSSAARSVAWAPDDRSLVVGGYDGAVHVLDLAGAPTGRFDDPRAWPRSVSTAGALAAVGSFWSTPHILELSSLRPVASPAVGAFGPNAMAVRGESLLVGCDTGTVLAVDLRALEAAGPRVRLLELAGSPILSLAVAGDEVYAGTYSGQVIRYDGAARHSERFGAPLPSLLCQGAAVVAGTYNGELLTLEPGSLALRERARLHDGSVKSMAAFDATSFVSCATDRTVTLRDGSDRNASAAVLWEHGNLVNAVASLGGSVIASASRDHTVKVGRVAREPDGTPRVQQVQTLIGPDESVKCVGLLGTRDAPVVLAGSYDFGLYVWRVRWDDSTATPLLGNVLATFEQGLSCICRVDDTTCAVAGWDGRILLVTTSGGEDHAVTLTADLAVSDLLGAAAPEVPVSA
ncbi:MAG: WD40 repeat domain-containing protein [Streptomycetales bacterium]